jgi:hypothetical protein
VAVSSEKKTNILHPLGAPLSARNCPEHIGASMFRVSENTYQCSLDNRIYNFTEGFQTLKGNVIQGTSVQGQTQLVQTTDYQTLFDTRESRQKQ